MTVGFFLIYGTDLGILYSIFSIFAGMFDTSIELFTTFFISVVPVKIYANSDIQKASILSENRKKAGIYRWINRLTGDSYIGSAVNLTTRFYLYFNAKALENSLAKSKSIIHRALLKYGYAAFSLEILEYCEPDKVIEREQYYLDSLKPSYNILTTAGSRLGATQSDETKAKMSASKQGMFDGENNPMYGKTHTIESRQSISNTRKTLGLAAGDNNPMRGKKHTPQSLALISAAKSRLIYVYEVSTNDLKLQPLGVTATSKTLHISTCTIYKYLNTGKVFKGLIIRDTPSPLPTSQK